MEPIVNTAVDQMPPATAQALCLHVAARYDALAARALKDSYARDRAEAMAKAARECAALVGQ